MSGNYLLDTNIVIAFFANELRIVQAVNQVGQASIPSIVLGELYWNGGYACVVLVLAGLFWFCWRCDTGARQGGLGLLLLCEFSPNLLQGMGYGFAQVARGALNGALVIGARWVWLRVASRRTPAASRAAPLPRARPQPGTP